MSRSDVHQSVLSFIGMILAVVLLFFISNFAAIAHAYNKVDSPYNHFDKAAKLGELSKIQYKVTQKNGTETPYDNAYWDNEKPGIYVDVISGEPLFSSLDKYDSNTGWPSFKKPLDEKYIVTKPDPWLFVVPRVEVRSKYADSHLGHLFDDGPSPTGKRYCMNSAALRFIPADKLTQEGYGEYLYLFHKNAINQTVKQCG